MTRSEQRTFIRELISNVRADLLHQLPLVPKEWDGIELRQWIADRFQESSWVINEKSQRRRRGDYRNAVLTMGRR